VGVQSGLTGADVARYILQDHGIRVSDQPETFPEGQAVALESTPGELTDHYDPTTRTLRLSQDIYSGSSIAALGIAAHEVGHAVQHARLYAPMQVRSLIYPVCNLGSTLALPLFFAGYIFSSGMFMHIGIWLFAAAVAFTFVTLPVEFDASRRALKSLATGGYLTQDEVYGAKKVLSAAAMTYVASAAMAAMQLLRLILLSRSRD
jgi:Zn-dependent membrane protease YugP